MPVLLLLCLLLPSALWAQSVPLVLDAGKSIKTVEVERSRGNAVFNLSALAPLGATVESDARVARLKLFGTTFTFEFTSPFFTVDNEVHQLASPARKVPRGVLVSTQFFTEFLPSHFDDRLAYAEGALTLKDAKKEPSKAKPTTTKPSTTKPLLGKPTPVKPTPARPTTTSSKESPVAANEKNSSAARVVVIDAGHGGKDPGAYGPTGLAEKNVTLAVALKLARLLRDRGFEVHLTRSRDTLIALADRPHLANYWKQNRPATLFVSIHANSGVRGSEGFETYFLSEARTEDERRVAEMENAAVKYEEKPVKSGPQLDLLLNSLRNDYYQRASNDFAEVIQRELGAFHPGPNRGVKQAGFRVLVGALMPAVLVEIGFMSHAQEVKLLGTNAFQDKIAFGLSRAIGAFFESHEHLWVEVR
jgi:N-acetylmuramoyl-L-alanine amidase